MNLRFLHSSNDLIPIVIGNDEKDYERIAPPDSFIHTAWFSSTKELADFLNYLLLNETAFIEFWHGRSIFK